MRNSDPAYVFGTEPNVYLTSHQPLFHLGQRALAVTDLEGRNSVWLARQGLVVDASDISSVAVNKAKQLANAADVLINFKVSEADATFALLRPKGKTMRQNLSGRLFPYR